jgi:DNA polymerase-3 subunit chi
MWEFDEDAYIPHQVAGQDEDDDQCPVLIAMPGAPADPRPMVINLRDEVAPGPFERVLEVVPADPAAREPLRERWKAYQARGLALKKHDM